MITPTATTASGQVSVTCSALVLNALVSYTIALSAGSGTFSTRTMKNGGNSLNYNIYTDTSYASVWGDGSSSTSLVSGSYTLNIGLISPRTDDFATCGKIPAGQTSAVGNYSDTITVTVTF